jgi:subtilisin family serine protease
MLLGAAVYRYRPILMVAIWLAGSTSTASLADAPDDHYYYYYFKERRTLTVDVTRVAMLGLDQQAVTLRLRSGDEAVPLVFESTARESLTEGWVFVPIHVAARDPDRVEEIVRSAANVGFAEFVSPVFVGEDGGPLVVSPVILIGFDRDISAAQANAILLECGAGEVLDRDWANMKNAFRVRNLASDGFEVLRACNRLAEHASVRFAEPDMQFTGGGGLIPNDPFFGNLWGLHNTGQSGGLFDFDMDAPEAWETTTGDPSIIVVVIDTGVQQDHPDINQLTPGVDTTSDGGDGGPVNACDNHGTPVAGCVSATINNNLGVVGAAPGCRTASARTFISSLSCTGGWSSFSSWTVNSLAWAESIGARVTNNSNFYGFTSSAIAQKYEDTRNAGMVHFAIAGNNASMMITYPGSLPTVNALAATNRFGQRASFSNYGPGLAFSAPGESIVTTDRTGSTGYVSGDYVSVQGTSFATPYAAAVAALILSINSELGAAAVEAIMQQTSLDLGASGYDTDFGWGMVNAGSAVLAVYECSPADVVSSDTFQPPSDGQVDAADLAYLLGEWGVNPASPADTVDSATFQPPADGVVDGADLAFLLGAWGVCE